MMIKIFGSMLKVARPLYFFGNSKKQHIFQLSRQLLANYKAYQPWKNIKIIHNLTMSKYDPDLLNVSKESDWRKDQVQIHRIINEMSGDLHKIPHREVNLLLEVLKERGYKYDKELAIFRALNKQAKHLFGKMFNAELLPMSLFYLKSLGFPKITIIKIFEKLAQILQTLALDKKSIHKIPLQIILSSFIVCLEEPFIPLPITKRILSYILNENASTLTSLCSLYHVSSIMTLCLDRKVEYQASKTSARQILFNPYHHLEEEENQEPPQKQEQNHQQSEYYLETKRKLVDISQNIQKTFVEAVDIKHLESTIVKSVEADIDPFSKQSLIHACDIKGLRGYLQTFVTQNLQKLTPVELIYFSKRLKDISNSLVDEYLSKMDSLMSVQQKCYLHLEAHEQLHRDISADLVLNILKQVEEITYEQFMAITRLTQKIPKAQEHQIKDIIKEVKRKMPEDENEGRRE